ncbi:MAG: hypothetical protein ACKN89_10100 [Cyanobium sp.]
MSQTPDAPPPGDTAEQASAGGHPHNFDIQKDVHRRISNDPDYDDWEYGTEPLPREAWSAAQVAAAAARAAASPEAASGS